MKPHPGCAGMLCGIGAVLSTAMALVAIVASFYVRFSAPELTETQLFLRCWHWYALTIIGCLFSDLFIRLLREKP